MDSEAVSGDEVEVVEDPPIVVHIRSFPIPCGVGDEGRLILPAGTKVEIADVSRINDLTVEVLAWV